VLPPGIAALATHAVLRPEIVAVDAAVLKKTSTVLVVVEAWLIRIESESTTAPSFALQSTSSVQPAPLGVLKSDDDVNAAVPPIVANECNGRSTSKGILLDELVAIYDLAD
jgi:hypothetical protein